MKVKAKMKDNLVKRYDEAFPGEIEAFRSACGEEEHKDFIQFLESIQKKEVNLVFAAGDAFEEKNNDYWLPNQLWDKVN